MTKSANKADAMSLKRLFLAFATLLVAAPCLAASVADRSPFAQGHWWNATRSGNGFDIFNAVGQVAVVWYTFDEIGRPVWYTALGPEASLGSDSWPLLQQRWTNGRKGEPTQVGSVKLTVNHPESMDLVWDIGGRQGVWKIEPLIVSGAVAEIDHGGSWFDPGQSGWGFGLTEQGSALGGALFTYDADGAPTWVSGFEVGGGRSVEFSAVNGACPWCTYRPSQFTSMGKLTFDFSSEWQGTVRSQLRLPMAPGISVDGARISMFSRPASMRPADRQLASFDADGALKAYLGAGLSNVGYPGPIAMLPSAPPVVGATTFSTTNLQESGVDEADLVKSNGNYVYAFAYDGVGAIKSSVRIARVGNEGASVDVLGSLALTAGESASMASAGLYLQGDRLVSLTGSQPYFYYLSPSVVAAPWMDGKTFVEVFSTTKPDASFPLWSAQIDGHIVTSRRIGDRLYVVTRFTPSLPGYVDNASSQSAIDANRQLLANTPVADLLPKARINGGPAEVLVTASAVYAPPQGSRKPVATMVLVTAIDLHEPKIPQALAIAGSVESVYVSSDHLFVASSRYELRDASGSLLPIEPSTYITDFHQVRLGTNAMSIVGSGSVEGFLSTDAEKAPFRMSENQGRFRAITSSNTLWGSSTKNRVTTLEPSAVTPGLLKTVSVLPNAKRPESLGKPGELLYGTRFVGDRLYAVTFRLIDPLYVVDLSDSADPRISAALELPGFSEYLHPLPNGLLLGFGKDARPALNAGDGQAAWYQGLQLSLYDVADAGMPREIQRVLMGKRGSDSALLHDHHAFSALMNADGSGTLAIPARLHDGAPLYGSGDSTYYSYKESGLLRFELRGAKPSDASLVQLPSLITHTAVQGATAYSDASSDGARSILFRNGTLYVGKGLFWRQDNAGNTFGPF